MLVEKDVYIVKQKFEARSAGMLIETQQNWGPDIGTCQRSAPPIFCFTTILFSTNISGLRPFLSATK